MSDTVPNLPEPATTLPGFFDLSGKVALVTGGSRGLGREMVRAFAIAGADVVIASRKLDHCEAMAAEVEALGRQALAISAHVGQWDGLEALVEAAYARFGKLDILVNNAGLSPVAPKSAAVTEDLFNKIIDVNFKGPFRLASLVAPRMIAAGGGCIINVSSTGAILPRPNIAVYAGAKAALNVITKSMAMEYGPSVRVNAIMAGPFWTDISKSWREERERTTTAAMRRIGRPQEVATAALYFASPQSSFTTGAVLQLDGGQGV